MDSRSRQIFLKANNLIECLSVREDNSFGRLTERVQSIIERDALQPSARVSPQSVMDATSLLLSDSANAEFINLVGSLDHDDPDYVADALHLVYLLSGQPDLSAGSDNALGYKRPLDYPLGDVLAKTSNIGQSLDAELLAELPSLLLHLNSGILRLNSSGKLVPLRSNIPAPVFELLTRVLESAVLYVRLLKTIKSVDYEHSHSSPGIVKQALYSAIDKELQGYKEVVGALDNMINSCHQRNEYMSLVRCLVLISNATLTLQVLDSIIIKATNLKGGQILSLLHHTCSHGDPAARIIGQRLLVKASKPFYELTAQWILSGNLIDEFEEFFVVVHNADAKWRDRFHLERSLAPSFFSTDLVGKIYEVGNSLHFLNVACDDRDWLSERLIGMDLVSAASYEEVLRIVDEAYKIVPSRLIVVLKQKFHLSVHLHALKSYLLLGNSRFVDRLLQDIAPSLDQLAHKLHRHDLTGALESAIRNSGVEHVEVEEAIDARMMKVEHRDETGWDIFVLDYRLGAPLDGIIMDRESRSLYLQLFHFLWHLKHAAFVLSPLWKEMSARGSAVPSIIRETHQVLNHFISVMETYAFYHVIETSWNAFQAELSAETMGINDIIDVHKKYLKSIISKCVLGKSSMAIRLELIVSGTIKPLRLIGRFFPAKATGKDQERIGLHLQSYLAQFKKDVGELTHELANHELNELKFLGTCLDFNGYYTAARRDAESDGRKE